MQLKSTLSTLASVLFVVEAKAMLIVSIDRRQLRSAVA